VEGRIQDAAMLSSLDRVKDRLGRVAMSLLVTRYPALQLLVQDTAAEVEQIARSLEKGPPQVRVAVVRIGEPAVSGRLRPGAARAALESVEASIRLCYQEGLDGDPDLAGALTVRFVVGRGGEVTSASSPEPEALESDTVACVLRTISGRIYPELRGGAAVVTVPLQLSSVDLDPVR
jgi:hypothetical protein